ncbi:transcription antitermination factor NusB [Suicoccus acidiformans]|uniref:transcription antitermination factor NusB n=1 Tax=Suicoccus acidiformans TaxID=2036206 RepID=UPI001F08B46F|nr:transcription antitermination factor NusB [Suicoccus acidiformans]
MSRKLSSRREARIIALQTLFQLTVNAQETSRDEALAFALEEGDYPEAGFDSISDPYVYTLIEGVQSHQASLDEIIQANLSNWTLSRLLPIDLTILRIAIYEMDYVDDEDVPPAVAVNEAIEISRGFSDDKSRKFISGVLLNRLHKNDAVLEEDA